MDPKPIWQSRTIWTNLVMAALAFYPPASEFLTARPELMMTFWAILNVILRLVTKDKIEIG